MTNSNTTLEVTMNDQERELKILLNEQQAKQLLNQIDFQKPRIQINTYYEILVIFIKRKVSL